MPSAAVLIILFAVVVSFIFTTIAIARLLPALYKLPFLPFVLRPFTVIFSEVRERFLSPYVISDYLHEHGF